MAGRDNAAVSELPPARRCSLEGVYARYGPWIRSKIRRYLRRDHDDALQDVLLKLHGALGNLRADREEAVRALVGRTVRSVCIDELRRESRRPAADPDVAAEQLADRVPDAAQSAERAEDEASRSHRLQRGWHTLPERDRQILRLRFHDGLSFREIAELLAVPQGSVAGWYSRAIARLQETV